MPTHNARYSDESRVRAWLSQAEDTARGVDAGSESKAVGPTVSSPMWGGANFGFADASTPHPADAPPWLNPVVASGLAWLGRAFVQADIEVRTTSGKDVMGEVVSDHELMSLLDRPNALNTFHSFCQAFLLSDVIDGNSYFIKVRKAGNHIHSLWWVPPWDVETKGSDSRDADRPIEGYWVAIDGFRKWYEPEEVIHVKDGCDPLDPFRGLAALKAGLRSIMTIDRAEMYTQTLMRNCGAIPTMISPANPNETIEAANVASLRGQFAENTTGYNNGKPFVSSQGLRVDRLGVTPEELALDKIVIMPIAVACSLMGTPAMVLGYPDPNKTYSNLSQATYSAWTNGVMPRQDRFAEAIDKACPELVSVDRERLVWNRTKVIALHAPVLERLDGLTKAAGGPILTPDEARAFISLGALPDKSGESIRSLPKPTPPSVDGGQGGTNDPTGDPSKQPGSNQPDGNTSDAPTTDLPAGGNSAGKSLDRSREHEREDDTRPFGEPIDGVDIDAVESKDDMPPRVLAGGEEPTPDPEKDNTYGLPTGKPIEDELIKWFKQQLIFTLGTVPSEMAEIPESFPPLTDYNDPMARAMTPILSVYWQESGDKEVGNLRAATGLDLSAWEVVNPKTAKKIEHAAYAFCDATNQTTSLSLDSALTRLRAEMTEGIVTHGESIAQLRKRVESVFENAEKYRAQRIAMSESSRAVHAAQEAADIESEVVAGFKWLLSSDACPLCHTISEKVGKVKAGEPFAVIGDNPAYRDIKHPPAHPGCRCSMTAVFVEEYGGPPADSDEWGKTLVQPKV